MNVYRVGDDAGVAVSQKDGVSVFGLRVLRQGVGGGYFSKSLQQLRHGRRTFLPTGFYENVNLHAVRGICHPFESADLAAHFRASGHHGVRGDYEFARDAMNFFGAQRLFAPQLAARQRHCQKYNYRRYLVCTRALAADDCKTSEHRRNQAAFFAAGAFSNSSALW